MHFTQFNSVHEIRSDVIQTTLRKTKFREKTTLDKSKCTDNLVIRSTLTKCNKISR